MQLPNVKKIFIFISGAFSLCVILFFVIVFPTEQKLAVQLPDQISKQEKIYHITYVKFTMINPYVIDAAIASQDRRFYNNLGVDLVGTVRALYYTAVSGQRQGASTITEQLAKNVYYHDKDTPETDIQTKLLAPFITLLYSKQYILEMYLNDIYFGKQAYGIYNASMTFFKTSPKDLSLSQSAYLMGLINVPSYFSSHTEQAIQEADIVLEQMQSEGYITPAQVKTAETKLRAQSFF